MRKYKILFTILGLMFLVAGCNHSTLEAAIDETIPYKSIDVLYQTKQDGTTIVLYSTKAKGEDVRHIKEPVLGVGFFEGNNEDGWENEGPNGWEYYERKNYTSFQQSYTLYDNRGKALKDMDAVFGAINNDSIEKIEIANQDSKDFKQVKIIAKEGKRYYLGIGLQPTVRALNGKGEVINQN